MASESRLYTLSPETKERLRKFRLGTSRSKEPQAVVYQIDKKTLEIAPSDADEVFTSLEDVLADLPDHVPRFVLLSYPLVNDSGRPSTPYVLLSYMPVTANAELRMLYAGAKELFRNEAEVNRVLDFASCEEGEAEEVVGRVRALA